ncbi:MAG: hypothetical protein FWH14_07630, partial [Oscillospiraceae bacterium]|nr:hypothetical protein [Oscillospiraceae bacterium]
VKSTYHTSKNRIYQNFIFYNYLDYLDTNNLYKRIKTPAAAAAPSLPKRAGACDYSRGGNLPPVGISRAFLYPQYARGTHPTTS